MRSDKEVYLERELEQSRLNHQSSEATLAMAVARLGGEVEGAPTHRINFLQRIDQLRRVESALQAILNEPFGCPFCDSGKLRNPNKDHTSTCGFKLAVEALGND